MRKIILEIEDNHFAAFEAVAHAKNVDPLEIIAKHLRQTAGIIGQVTHLSADALATKIQDLAALSLDQLAVLAVSTHFDNPALTPEPFESTLEQRRARRLAILQGGSPLWKGEEGKPKDGLLYEKELRAEW
jgi:hypothetical protein